MSVRILALVGSLRAGSHNRQLAEAAVKLAPEGVEIALHEGLAEIPFYNEDIDVEGGVPPPPPSCARPPRPWTRCCSSPPSTTAPSRPC